jgi:hypothetical protein
MRIRYLASASLLAFAMSGWLRPATADTATANCEVHKEGKFQPLASGPCSFSQRQGFIDISLRDGETYTLSPKGPDLFEDQMDHSVARTKAGEGEQTFRWPEKRIVVRFE